MKLVNIAIYIDYEMKVEPTQASNGICLRVEGKVYPDDIIHALMENGVTAEEIIEMVKVYNNSSQPSELPF